MGNTRNRRTREEMLAHYEAEAERVRQQIAGSYKDESENAVLKQLAKRLRKTETELRAATITVNGVAGSEGKGWSKSPIDEKIATTEARLATQVETKARAEAFQASLPFDIERLQALVNAAKEGEDVEMPSDLTPLADEQERTDEEHEAAFIASEENEGEEN